VKKSIGALAIVAVLALGIGGCAQLTEAQKARIEVLSQKNETLAGELSTLYTEARQGLADPAEIVAAIQKVTAAMAANHEEIKKIQAEGATTSTVIAGVIGLFGRTALHAAASFIPGGGPLAALASSILTGLLGGSTSNKVAPAPIPPKEA